MNKFWKEVVSMLVFIGSVIGLQFIPYVVWNQGVCLMSDSIPEMPFRTSQFIAYGILLTILVIKVAIKALLYKAED
jgi:hypothetical protein